MRLGLELTPELQVFHGQMSDWIAENKPAGLDELADWTTPWGVMGRYQLVQEARRHPLHAEWEARLLAAHLICPQWPESVGGRGWDAVQLAIFDLACHEAGVPRIERGMGESLVGPSILGAGTPAQVKRFLPRIVSGEDVYCQGFSEPDHGSDLAAVSTRGVVDGEEIVITGQKVWTSSALAANMIFVLCRTDPSAPKHRGLSFVLVPFARDNGVQVRGIQMLNGFGEFCEDYFDGARAPLDNVIGGLNNGWQVAMTALSYERGAEATTQYLAYLPEFWAIVDQARKIGRDDDPLTRQQLAQAYLNVELMRYGGMRTLARLIHGLSPGPLEAINKLHKSEYHRWLGEVAIDLDDTSGLIRPQGTGYPTTRWQDLFLSSRAGTIYSGTSEIQRNIVGERMLGLPKEPAADARAGAKGTSPRATSAPAATMARGVSGQDQALPGFLPNTEQQALAKNVRVFLASQSPVSAARELMTEPAGFDRRCWDLMATQLGLHGLRIPEQFGGAEQGFTELRIVLSELGRELYTGPYLSSMLTIEAIIASADAGTMARLLPSLADGTAIGALAIWDEVGAYRSSEIRTRAHHNKYGWTLEGDKAIVLHGQAATVLITAAATEGGLSLFAVDASAAGVSVNPQPALDQTRQIASIRLEGAPGSLIGQEGAAGPLIQTILDRAALAIAADSLGVAERVLEMTVDYAKMRNQFGRPIGSFQAVKHKCADMLKSIELGRSAIYYAAHIADTEPAELTPAASIAKIQCAEACTIAAAESIQIHGGVGFTWEHDAHLYFKRARANATLFGNQAFHRERLLYAIGV